MFRVVPNVHGIYKRYISTCVCWYVRIFRCFVLIQFIAHLFVWVRQPTFLHTYMFVCFVYSCQIILLLQSSTMTCSAMQVSVDGLLCCTISSDHSVKIYDVVNYDMMVMIRTRFVPGAVDWVYKQGDVKARLAISDRNSSFVHIFDARAGTNEPIISREVCCSVGRGVFFFLQSSIVY